MRKIINHYNYVPSPPRANTMPSRTIPDQTMSLREIMERYARGLPIDGVKVPIYDGENNDLPDIRTLDLAERQEYAAIFSQELEQLRIAQKPPENPISTSLPTQPINEGDTGQGTDLLA